jgi:hypothetical protein
MRLVLHREVASAVNADTDTHGIKATVHGNNVVLEGANIANANIKLLKSDGTADAASSEKCFRNSCPQGSLAFALTQ